MTDDEQTPIADERALLLLEGRRLAYDAAMWQAPTLVLIVQGFLLAVLTNSGVRFTVAVFVALAGVAALLVAGLALWQLHDREHHFSERVTAHAIGLTLGDPTRHHERRCCHLLEWPAWVLWEAVLGLFAVADVLALFLTCRT
jgi:hypothetical protein